MFALQDSFSIRSKEVLHGPEQTRPRDRHPHVDAVGHPAGDLRLRVHWLDGGDFADRLERDAATQPCARQ